MEETHEAPKLLIGHSLGRDRVDGIGFVDHIGHVAGHVGLTVKHPSFSRYALRLNPNIERDGEGEVVIGGRTHLIKTQLLDSLRRQEIKPLIESIQIPHLVLHSPTDEMLAIDHADDIFSWTGGAKAFVTLPGSDHLLINQPEDVGFVADLIASWSKRYFLVCTPN